WSLQVNLPISTTNLLAELGLETTTSFTRPKPSRKGSKEWIDPPFPPLPESRPVTLMQLTCHQCAVILDSGLYCGAPLTGRPFRMCEGHANRLLWRAKL